MAVQANLTGKSLIMRNIIDLDNGKTKTIQTYFSNILTEATDEQMLNLATAIDSINEPVMEDAYKQEKYKLSEV